MWRLFLYVNSLQERQQKNKKTAESHRDFLIHISVVSSFSCLLRYSFLCHSRQRMFLSISFFCFAFARCARCARSSRRCHAATIRRPIHLFYAVECCRRCFVFKYFIGIFLLCSSIRHKCFTQPNVTSSRIIQCSMQHIQRAIATAFPFIGWVNKRTKVLFVVTNL